MAGISESVGSTHFSIMLAAFLTKVMRKKTIVICIGDNRDFVRMMEFYNGIKIDNQNFMKETYDNIEEFEICKIRFIYSVCNGYKNMAKLIEKISVGKYDKVVFDTGVAYEDFSDMLCMGDRYYMIGNISLWQQADFEQKIRNSRETDERKWRYLYSFGDEKNAEIFQKDNYIELRNIPFCRNPFVADGNVIDAMRKIIMED